MIWKELLELYKGKLFILQGNEESMKEYIKGYFSFLLNQNDIILTYKKEILIEKSNLALFCKGNSEIGGFLNLAETGEGIILPCGSKFREANLNRIKRALLLPSYFIDIKEMNFQEQVVNLLLKFKVTKLEEDFKQQRFKNLLFEKNPLPIFEEIGDLLSLI